jgi:6-pyruvoyltetrahydropterin/6-carboxytetrahydropterin synthase
LPAISSRYPGQEVTHLGDRLIDCLAPLDYRLLNEIIEIPTDENIARWIRDRIEISPIESVGVQGTDSEGVDIDATDNAHIWRRYTFEAAHRLPKVAVGHKCGRMHGHGFEVILHAVQSATGKDVTVDYDDIDKIWRPLHQQLNYACLNDIPGLENPTSELISSWIWHRLKEVLPELAWVTVYETATCGAHFDGSRYRIWKEMAFDSAVRLSRLPESHRAGRIHGHTYALRLHLSGPIDQVMGWIADFGDVKEMFTPMFKTLDHHPLYEIDDLDDNDVATLLRWIRDKSLAVLPALDRVDLYETRGCGGILTWGPEPRALPI